MKKKIITGILTTVILCATFMTPLQTLAADSSERSNPELVFENVHPASEVVAQTTGNIVLSLTSNQQTPQYAHGEKKELKLQITNSGTADASGVSIIPNIEADTNAWPFEIENKDYRQNIGEIKAGETVQVTYDLQAREDVATQYYKVNFTIGVDQGGTQSEIQQGIYIKTQAKPVEQQTNTASNTTPNVGGTDNKSADIAGTSTGEDSGVALAAAGGFSNSEPVVTGGTPTSGSVPRVIVTGFTTSPGAVTAGGNFRLVVKVKNTSASTQVKNMTIGFTAPTEGKDENTAPAFLPSAGANTLYIDQIAAGAERDVTIDLNAKQDLVQKPYSLDLAMSYEDGANTQYQSSSSVAIPIKQAARFEFSKISVNPESVAVGEEANVTADLYNLGKVKLYNVKVKIDGNSIKTTEAFLGNVESGSTANIDLMATGEKETKGAEKVKMILSYEDADGKVSTNEQEFFITVTPEVKQMVENVEETKSKKGFPIVPTAVGFVIVIAIGFVIFRKLKNRKEELEDEMDGPFEDE